MSSDSPQSQGRNTVFFLEDNPDVLDATVAFFETKGIPVVRAVTPADAWRELAGCNETVRLAYIDKTLQREQSAGLDFVESARSKYPGVEFAVVTAWPLTDAEKARVASKNIRLLEKANSTPADLLARFNRQSGPPSTMTSTTDDYSSPEVASADILFRARLAEQTLSEKEERFHVRLGRIGRDLVRRLVDDSRFGDGPVYIGASEYTTDELVQEICEGSELGLSLLDSHFAELEDLARKVHGR